MNSFRIILAGLILVLGITALRLKLGAVYNNSDSPLNNILLILLTVCMLITLILDIRAFKVSRNWANLIPSVIGLFFVGVILT